MAVIRIDSDPMKLAPVLFAAREQAFAILTGRSDINSWENLTRNGKRVYIEMVRALFAMAVTGQV